MGFFDGFSAVVDAEFAVDGFGVGADSVEGDIEAVGNLAVFQAFCNELEDFEFPVGEWD